MSVVATIVPSARSAPVGEVAPLGAEVRIAAAAVRCIARWGVAKTTLDDVAREAGCSRATIYRLFPGGKDSLLDAVVHRELATFLDGVRASLTAATNLEDLLVAAIREPSRRLLTHDALGFVLRHEPGLVLPLLCFANLDPVLAQVRDFGAPLLARFLPEADAPAAVEWITRIVLSYAMSPSEFVDVTDEASVRQVLVRGYVMPALAKDHVK